MEIWRKENAMKKSSYSNKIGDVSCIVFYIRLGSMSLIVILFNSYLNLF